MHLHMVYPMDIFKLMTYITQQTTGEHIYNQGYHQSAISAPDNYWREWNREYHTIAGVHLWLPRKYFFIDTTIFWHGKDG